MNKIKKNSLLLLILTIIILFIILKDNFIEIYKTLLNVNVLYFILLLIVYLIYFIFDNLCYYKITKEYNKNIDFKFILNLGIITKFFNGITPLASGGQPLQIYYLSKNGIKPSKGTNIIVQNYIIFQIVLLIITIFSIIIGFITNIIDTNTLLFKFTICGFIINTGILIFLLLLSFDKKFITSIVRLSIKILNKLRIIKDYDEILKKCLDTCNNYYENTKVLFKNKRVFFTSLVYQLIAQILFYSIPLFVSLALECKFNLNLLYSIICGCLIYTMGCYVPVPGASGGMEYGFIGYMGIFITVPEVYAVLLIWRFITYYLPTVIGGIMFSISLDKKEKKELLN